jgi:hypothetical protein
MGRASRSGKTQPDGRSLRSGMPRMALRMGTWALIRSAPYPSGADGHVGGEYQSGLGGGRCGRELHAQRQQHVGCAEQRHHRQPSHCLGRPGQWRLSSMDSRRLRDLPASRRVAVGRPIEKSRGHRPKQRGKQAIIPRGLMPKRGASVPTNRTQLVAPRVICPGQRSGRRFQMAHQRPALPERAARPRGPRGSWFVQGPARTDPGEASVAHG